MIRSSLLVDECVELASFADMREYLVVLPRPVIDQGGRSFAVLWHHFQNALGCVQVIPPACKPSGVLRWCRPEPRVARLVFTPLDGRSRVEPPVALVKE